MINWNISYLMLRVKLQSISSMPFKQSAGIFTRRKPIIETRVYV